MTVVVSKRSGDRELEFEIVCRGVGRETFLEFLHDIKTTEQAPRVAIRNPDPLIFAADTLHTLRVVFENHAVKALGVYASKKAIDLLFDLAKARLTQTPKSEHPQAIEICGPDGKRVTRKR